MYFGLFGVGKVDFNIDAKKSIVPSATGSGEFAPPTTASDTQRLGDRELATGAASGGAAILRELMQPDAGAQAEAARRRAPKDVGALALSQTEHASENPNKLKDGIEPPSWLSFDVRAVI